MNRAGIRPPPSSRDASDTERFYRSNARMPNNYRAPPDLRFSRNDGARPTKEQTENRRYDEQD